MNTDITRNAGWDIITQAGLRPVSQVSINDTWEALRFRPVDFVEQTLILNKEKSGSNWTHFRSLLSSSSLYHHHRLTSRLFLSLINKTSKLYTIQYVCIKRPNMFLWEANLARGLLKKDFYMMTTRSGSLKVLTEGSKRKEGYGKTFHLYYLLSFL